MLRSAAALAEVIWNHPANCGQRVQALGRSAAWQVYKRTIAKPFDLSAFGFRFRCYPDSHDASRMVYFNGFPDPAEMEFCRRYLRPGDSVIDAGANVGVYSLFFASVVGPDGFVLAFEPDPETSRRLRENVSINSLRNVAVREAALADTAGTAQFTQGADTGNTLYSLKTYGRPAQTVEVSTLDTVIGTDTYALCKMDIEGAELKALEGAAKSLSRHTPPVWIMELSEKSLARSNHSVADVEAMLNSFGYWLWRYRDGGLVPFVSKDRKPGQVGDGIAIYASELDEVRARVATPPAPRE